MIHAKIQSVAGKAVIQLEDADLEALGATVGDTVTLDAVGEGSVERGKAFVERYIKTFEALAK